MITVYKRMKKRLYAENDQDLNWLNIEKEMTKAMLDREVNEQFIDYLKGIDESIEAYKRGERYNGAQ